MPPSPRASWDRPTVFVSYSHQDESWKNRLVKQLQVLEPAGALEVWDDRRIAAGADWRAEIEQAMDRAVAAVLLISADFLTSEFVLGTEVPRLLAQRRDAGAMLVLPVIVHPCDWEGIAWLAPIQCRPRNGRPLSRFSKPRAEADLAALATEIRHLLDTTPQPRDRTRRKPVPATELDPEITRYLERLRSGHRDLPIAGFATRVRLPIRLESVYVPLRARVVHHALESEHQKPGSFRELREEAGEDREVGFDAALPLAHKHGFRGAVVLGDPGTGKTTLLKHFLLAEPGRLSLPEETVPVLVELRRLKAPAAGLRAALTEAVERADPALDAPAFALGLLRRDHLLVLVDGLDEIADPGERAEVSRWLEDAVGTLPHSTFVITSRYAGYKGEARFTGRFLELHVRDLGELEARRFIHDWYRAVEAQAELGRAPEVAGCLAEEAAAELGGRIFDRADPRTASLAKLATNPLMLQILCLVHRDRKHLPEHRVELYGECCQVLLELWRRAKGMPVVPDRRPGLEAPPAPRLLAPCGAAQGGDRRGDPAAPRGTAARARPEPGGGRGALRGDQGSVRDSGRCRRVLHLSPPELPGVPLRPPPAGPDRPRPRPSRRARRALRRGLVAGGDPPRSGARQPGPFRAGDGGDPAPGGTPARHSPRRRLSARRFGGHAAPIPGGPGAGPRQRRRALPRSASPPLATRLGARDPGGWNRR